MRKANLYNRCQRWQGARCYWQFPSLLCKGGDNPQLLPPSPHQGRDMAPGNGMNLHDPCNLIAWDSFIPGLGCAQRIWQSLGAAHAVGSRDWQASLSIAQGRARIEKCLILVWAS